MRLYSHYASCWYKMLLLYRVSGARIAHAAPCCSSALPSFASDPFISCPKCLVSVFCITAMCQRALSTTWL